VRVHAAIHWVRVLASRGCITPTERACTAAWAKKIFAMRRRLPATASTAATRNMSSRPKILSMRFLMDLLTNKLPRCFARALLGFGAAAHIAIQVARHWNVTVYASTRDARHQKLALELGAAWAGGTLEAPPEKLDAAIVFAPAGEIVPGALAALRKGGALVLGGIHMSPIPSFSYDLLYQERAIRSVANNTRQDGEDFLRVAVEIPIRMHTQIYPLREANRALNALKNDAIEGAAVLRVSE
jgi:hypothetical protein